MLALPILLANAFWASAQEYCTFLKKVQDYQNGVKLLEHKNDECNPAEVDSTTFNIKTYLNLFDQLKLPHNKDLYLCNYYGWSAGQPILYVRPKSFSEEEYYIQAKMSFNLKMDSILTARSTSYGKDASKQKDLEFVKKWVNRQKGCFTKKAAMIQYARDSINRAEYNLIPNDTKDGFIQLLFFSRMGDRFALYWHSNYQLRSIICDKKDMLHQLEYYTSQVDTTKLDKKKLADISQADVSPKVSVTADYYFIEWYEFEPHEGLFKRCFSIERHYPYKVKQECEDKKLEACLNFFY